VGSELAVTLTGRLAVAVPLLPSVTVSTTVLAPRAVLHKAAVLAVIVPLILLIPVTVSPAGTVVAVTIKLPAAVSLSLTVAMVETVPALPCCRVNTAAAVIVGRLFCTEKDHIPAVAVSNESQFTLATTFQKYICPVTTLTERLVPV
jgi:hypothetical protein